MSEDKVTLEFLARQVRGMRDDVLSVKDDIDDMFSQMRAMVRQHQRFSERLHALEEEER